MERINWASIVLITKVAGPEKLGDYRPISLINSTLKILSKLLATRLSKVMNMLVDEEQSAYIKGRCIIENVALADEHLFSMRKQRLPGHILKVDFAKVFGHVDWEF